MIAKRLDAAVAAVYQELISTQTDYPCWRELPEETLFREVAASILGSRVSFEMALSAIDRLAEEGLLRYSGNRYEYCRSVEEVLSRPLSFPGWQRCRRYRFPKARSSALAATADAFYSGSGSIKEWLNRFRDSRSARRALLAKAMGVGPKQASMILRNILFSDQLAILDSHLLCFMRIRGIADFRASHVARLAGYEIAENRFLDYASRSGMFAPVLDQAIWVVMRVYTSE